MGVSILKANKNGQTQLVMCSTANVGIDLISSPIPIQIFLAYKGSLCKGDQCFMIYEIVINMQILNTF